MVTNAISRKLRCKIFATEHIVYRIRQRNSIKLRIFFEFGTVTVRYQYTDPSVPLLSYICAGAEGDDLLNRKKTAALISTIRNGPSESLF